MRWPSEYAVASSLTIMRVAALPDVTADMSKLCGSVVADVARIGIDHGEEHADALLVLLHRPIRWPARREPVALVRPAQPVVVGAAVSTLADGERSPSTSTSTSRVNNIGPGLPAVPRYTSGTAWGSSLPPLRLPSTTASIHRPVEPSPHPLRESIALRHDRTFIPRWVLHRHAVEPMVHWL